MTDQAELLPGTLPNQRTAAFARGYGAPMKTEVGGQWANLLRI